MKLFKFSFRPSLLSDLRGYDTATFFRDLSAGLTVGIVALPLAMAFAIASGVKPEAGIYTAIIGGFLVSTFGGSRIQIGGPAGAFIVIIYGIVEKYGVANLLIATMFAGMMLFAMGLFRLGSLIRHIPVPIVIGFTNGIAVLIALSQMKDFFGLHIDKMPDDFFAQTYALAENAHSFNLTNILIAVISLLLLFLWPKLWRPKASSLENTLGNMNKRILQILRAFPSTILVLILATLAVSTFNLQVETIGSKFGGIPQSLPSFQLPQFTWELVKQLFPPALTIALLGAIESLLCARVADNITGDRHNPNQELMAQGMANFITPFFGGIPVTGTIARTVTNLRAGAATPIAGILHALTLLAIVLIAAPLANNIPLAALAAILLYVAYNMGEWHEFARLRHFSMNYRVLMLATFLLTVIVDLTVAVQVGLVLSSVFFIYRISSLTRIEKISSASLTTPLPPSVMAYSIFGVLFFGAVDKLEALIEPQTIPQRVMILELHQLIKLDATGLDALETVHKTLQKKGCQLILCGSNQQPLEVMRSSGFLERLGTQNYLNNLNDAIERSIMLVQ